MDSVPTTYREMFRFFFSGSGAWSMLALLGVVVAVKCYVGWFWWDVLLFIALFLLRGIFEWLTHSLLYHANPLPFLGWRLKSETWRQHMEHHKDPYDLERILITHKGAVLPSIMLFFLVFPLSGSLDFPFSLMLVSLILGALNELGHLVCHCRIEHKTYFMRRFVWLHRQHHFNNPNRLYGVTSALGDRCFGTFVKGDHENVTELCGENDD